MDAYEYIEEKGREPKQLSHVNHLVDLWQGTHKSYQELLYSSIFLACIPTSWVLEFQLLDCSYSYFLGTWVPTSGLFNLHVSGHPMRWRSTPPQLTCRHPKTLKIIGDPSNKRCAIKTLQWSLLVIEILILAVVSPLELAEYPNYTIARVAPPFSWLPWLCAARISTPARSE